MKNVTYFLLGIAIVVLTSAPTVSVRTVNPATPKATATFVGDINQCSKHILTYSQKGYVVKFMSQSQSQYTDYDETRCLVVMEKY
jgi:hypothetical protein